MNHLNPTAFGLSTGILWGLGMLILGVAATVWGYGTTFVDLMGTVYIGSSATWPGVFFGLVWGFVDGYIGGFLLAWLYNQFS